ncbi:restriction endonuclease subunit S [Aliarcobacter cryaerophilus]|uniref:Type I restriction modification DNA specificity domain-containing protein n=1 Tax=Aliarcobacter cryaerophilus TaxID=28198 RepID=A0A2S9TPF0_9BACT|nr:restriction endonuclease subunit S [Aliarcobacter cryaerophilus]PRN00711.1 hypothetical protein CJ668_05685 [Arcobacter cryaerophilus gv. pseudocryaerophilus]
MSELYSLPNGWEWKKLGKIAKLQNGFAFKSKLFVNDGLPIVRIKNIKNEKVLLDDVVYFNVEDYGKKLDSYQIKKNDILIAMSGATTGKIGLYDTEEISYLNQRVGLFRIENSNLRSYLFYFLSTQIEKNLELSLGAAQPNLSTEQINNIELPLPPLEEQKRIVVNLDNLFAKIDKAIALHQKNIDEADIFMASVLNDVFVELEEKYGLIKINDVVVKTKNKNPLNEKDTPFTYIDISSIDNKSFKIVEPKQLIGSEAPSRAKKEVFQGDIVYSTTRPNLKNIAIVSENYNNSIASTGFCVLRTNEKTINYYLFYFLITEKLFEQIEPNIRGAQYPATSDNDLKNCNIPNTPYETQQKVVSYLDEISNKMEKIKQIQKEKMQSLKELKASILDKAFKGEL